MANLTFNSFFELREFLNYRIQQSLQNEVAQEIVAVMRRNIQKYVYNAYTPTHYKRTYKLLDRGSIQVQMVSRGLLKVRNYRRDESGVKDVAKIIETGSGYTWKGDLDSRIGARPFHQKTMTELINNKNHVRAFRRGLRIPTYMS